ncbi:MAG: ribonuclease P protein component 4 [Candidatus Aenigmatarchaeota archaeon]
MKRGKKPEWQKQIANERIKILFSLARKNAQSNPSRSKRYVQLARKIGLRYNIRFSKNIKQSFCKKCNSILIPGKTSAVRISKKMVNIICKDCGNIIRVPLKDGKNGE